MIPPNTCGCSARPTRLATATPQSRIVEAVGLRLSGAGSCDLSGTMREWRHDDETATLSRTSCM